MSISSFRAELEPEEWDAPDAPTCATPSPQGARARRGLVDAGSSPRPRHRRLSGRVVPFLVGGDLGGVAVAGLLTVLVSSWTGARLSPGAMGMFLLVSCPVVAVATVAGVRTRAARLVPRVTDDLRRALVRLAVAGFALLAGAAITASGALLPPLDVMLLLGLTATVVPLARRLALALAAASPARRARVVVIGTGQACEDLCRRLRRSPLVTIAGVVGGTGASVGALSSSVEDLPTLCLELDIDRVVIAFGAAPPDDVVSVLQPLRGTVDIDVVVRYFELASWRSRLHDVTGLSLMQVGPAPGPGLAALKRVTDFCMAGTLLVLLSPLFVLIALGVLVDSGRPVLFRQTRVGRGRQPFEILKFRTMRADGHQGAARSRTPLALPDAARVTRLGRVLRRAGIDELPQLVNILRGEMSLVGPRPFVPEECAGLDGSAEARFGVRPGLTGLWQVSGQHATSFEELCRLDVQYATSWSFAGDLRILARTPSRLVRGSG